MKTTIIEDEETSSNLRGSGSAAKSPVNSAQNPNFICLPVPLISQAPPYNLSPIIMLHRLESCEIVKNKSEGRMKKWLKKLFRFPKKKEYVTNTAVHFYGPVYIYDSTIIENYNKTHTNI